MEHLFIYGSLLSRFGHPVHQELERLSDLLGVALCPGRLYDVGDYPGMRPTRRPDELVRGELYALKDATEAFRVLDPYEGYDPANEIQSEFVRHTVLVRRENGEEILAWAYFYHAKPDESRRIASGDYLKHRGLA